MADYTIPNLTTAIDAIPAEWVLGSLMTNVISITNGTVNVGNISITNPKISPISNLSSGWLTGRRPVSGQVFPRGVYNK